MSHEITVMNGEETLFPDIIISQSFTVEHWSENRLFFTESQWRQAIFGLSRKFKRGHIMKNQTIIDLLIAI